MKIYRLHKKQNFPISVEKAWSFLSNPENLKIITPDYMSFDILSGADRPMYPLKNYNRHGFQKQGFDLTDT